MEYITAMLVAAPVILFPVCFVWYLNLSGLYQLAQKRRALARRIRVREHL